MKWFVIIICELYEIGWGPTIAPMDFPLQHKLEQARAGPNALNFIGLRLGETR